MTNEPSSVTEMPATPWAAWATMPSRRDLPGSDGAAGRRCWLRTAKSTASDGSTWGRLPMEVAKPTGRRMRPVPASDDATTPATVSPATIRPPARSGPQRTD